MDSCRIPRLFESARVAQLDETFSMVSKYKLRSEKGILLSGPPGVGKSFALAAMTNQAIEQHRNTGKRFDYAYITAPDFFDVVPAFAGQDGLMDVHRNQQWVETLTKVNWLVLNDLGKEYRGGLLAQQIAYKLGRVLRTRAERKLVTHVSTNLDLDDLIEWYTEPTESLMHEIMNMYEVEGPDRRKRKKKP